MTFREALKKIQTEYKCEHPIEIGRACDEDSGGWTTCGCAVMAMKMMDRNGETGEKK
jgi:hypothetical protein